jgi:hypothetical protein
MNNERADDLVFDATASCAVVFVATAFVALLYRLIAVVVPLLGSTIASQMTAPGGW